MSNQKISIASNLVILHLKRISEALANGKTVELTLEGNNNLDMLIYDDSPFSLQDDIIEEI